MGTTPWRSQEFVKEGNDYPATYVSWDDAVEFSRRLSANEGRTYRLPTEAEWEYACRAGSRTAYSFGDSPSALTDHAWFDRNASDVGEQYAHRVGQKLTNAFGLYDMHGNVKEWCADWYAEAYYSGSPVDDPTGPGFGKYRVLRGGSWDTYVWYTRSAKRRVPAAHPRQQLRFSFSDDSVTLCGSFFFFEPNVARREKNLRKAARPDESP